MAKKPTKEKIPARKRKPLGRALPPVKNVPIPTKEELDIAESLWDTYAPPRYRGMMNAENLQTLQRTGKQPSGRFVWNPKTMTYRNVVTGHVVNQDEALAAVAAFVQAYGKA